MQLSMCEQHVLLKPSFPPFSETNVQFQVTRCKLCAHSFLLVTHVVFSHVDTVMQCYRSRLAVQLCNRQEITTIEIGAITW